VQLNLLQIFVSVASSISLDWSGIVETILNLNLVLIIDLLLALAGLLLERHAGARVADGKVAGWGILKLTNDFTLTVALVLELSSMSAQIPVEKRKNSKSES
jgi:hypothetical protein